MNKKAFTLIELLVVVLIIGILAGIALPKYQLVVGKAKFSTLKTIAKNIADACNRYYLIHNTYPNSITDLDIDLSGGNGVSCMIWNNISENKFVACEKLIFGTKMRFYILRYSHYHNMLPFDCLTYSKNTNDITNRICQLETGTLDAGCGSDYCTYHYKK